MLGKMTKRFGPVTAFLVPVSLLVAGLQAQKFLPDDPIWEDRDDLPIEKPAAMILSPSFDALENLIGSEARGPQSRAANINTLGEVPDSNWFTNRMGTRDLPLEELVRGPDRTSGPDTGGLLTIKRAGLLALSDGLEVIDSRGDRYLLKFDPRSHPTLASAADLIATKFFHAIGYHTVPTHVAYVDPNQLRIDASAQVFRLGRSIGPLRADYLKSVLDEAARLPDGRYRVAANHLPEGEVVGGFKFYGTRSDDPNDIFPHEDRRELRALRVFAEWLNFTSASGVHTLDVYVDQTGNHYLRHHLIDFRTALGSGRDFDNRIIPKDRQDGNEYALGFNKPSLKTAVTLGIWTRPWMKVDFTSPGYAEIGRIESDFFEPGRWKPYYPNPAFDKMRADDAFWAAKIVARFSDQAIRAIVAAGGFSDPMAEKHLADTLIRRRDKIVSHYLRQVNPLDGFRLVDSALEFENLGERQGLAADSRYEYQWFAFDNSSASLTPLQETQSSEVTHIPLPSPGPDYLMVRIRTRSESEPGWARAVDVYVRMRGERPSLLVGIERETGGDGSDS